MRDLSARRRRLGRLLQTIRRDCGVTQNQLAERLAVPESVITALENGERGPDFVEVVAVCEALGTSLDSFRCRWESTSEDFEGD